MKKNTGMNGEYHRGCILLGAMRNSAPSEDWCIVDSTTPRTVSYTHLQDSCNYIRNHGLAEHTRYIMSQIAEDFREMKCNREDNFCCGGGGGFNGIGKFRPQRDKGLYMKLQQIRETGAKMVISPCHNCWDAIRDMMEVYHVHDIKWSFLKPIIIDMMIVPDHLKPQDDE